jgi:hypothetical protein
MRRRIFFFDLLRGIDLLENLNVINDWAIVVG